MAKKVNKYAGDVPVKEYEPHGVAGWLGLGRSMDLGDGVTSLCFLCTVITFIGVTSWQTFAMNLGFGDAALGGMGAALGFLFSYMVAQELDPDRQWGGIIGGFLTLAAFFWLGEGNIVVMLWLLMLLRMFTRTSGDRHRAGDCILIILLSTYMGYKGFWLYPLMTGSAFILESQIPEGYNRSLIWAGVALAGMIFAEFGDLAPVLSMEYIYLMGATFVLFMPEMRAADFTRYEGDRNGKRISPARLRIGQAVFLTCIFFLPFLHGNEQALALLPAMAAGIGCGVYLVPALMQAKKNK